jgi:PAS domain S-box-containing protein
MEPRIDEITKIRRAQRYVNDQIKTLMEDPPKQIDDFKWLSNSDDIQQGLYRISVTREGHQFTLAFSEEELIESYNNREAETRFKTKVETFLNEVHTEDEKVIVSELKGLHRRFAELYAPEQLDGNALSNSEDRYKSLVENLPFAVYYSNLYGKFLYGNKKAEELTGYKKEELIGRNYFNLKLINRKALLKAIKLLRQNLSGKATGPDSFVITRKDGDRRLVKIYTQIIPFGKKKVVLGIVQDITEYKQIEERYDLATQAGNVGVWDWNIQTGEFYLDKNIKAILGYTDEEIPNDIDTWVKHVHPDDKQNVMDAVQAHLDGKTPQYICEHQMLHKDESIRWIFCRGIATRDANGRAIRMMGTDMDITERKKAETERDELILELQAALDKIKQLSGLLPICSKCKKIRDDKGYWHHLENYIHEHSEADFTHSVCPDCLQEYSKEIAEQDTR